MACVWLTYSWDDNENGDIDFYAQELIKSGLSVKLDQWNIGAGKRLWEQIAHFIKDPNECDAWVLIATQNSLGSDSCKEELAYALDRALHSRGKDFPIIGLFPATVDYDLIPASINVRRYVSITDPDWKERIKAAAEGRALEISRKIITPYDLKVHEGINGSRRQCAIELRPRAGTWSPFLVAIPVQEKEDVNARILRGPMGCVPNMSVLSGFQSGIVTYRDKKYWYLSAQDEATPTQSYYVKCDRLPSKIVFGVKDGKPMYEKYFDGKTS